MRSGLRSKPAYLYRNGALVSDIEFEDPPERRRAARLSHSIIAAQLREKPRQWAVVDRRPTSTSARGLAYTISHAMRLPAYRPVGSFEAMARTVDVRQGDGTRKPEFRVYARFVGEAAADG